MKRLVLSGSSSLAQYDFRPPEYSVCSHFTDCDQIRVDTLISTVYNNAHCKSRSKSSGSTRVFPVSGRLDQTESSALRRDCLSAIGSCQPWPQTSSLIVPRLCRPMEYQPAISFALVLSVITLRRFVSRVVLVLNSTASPLDGG